MNHILLLCGFADFPVGNYPEDYLYYHGDGPADREAHVDGLQGSQFREYRIQPGNSDTADADDHQDGR